MWIPLAVLALTITATTWPRSREMSPRNAAVISRVVAAQLSDVPSHNRQYRASLDLTSDSVWIVRVQSASGVPVPDARVLMKAWMPEQERVTRAMPLATEYSSAGTYRVRPVALDEKGWWNFSVQIVGAGSSDSLAFNMILK